MESMLSSIFSPSNSCTRKHTKPSPQAEMRNQENSEMGLLVFSAGYSKRAATIWNKDGSTRPQSLGRARATICIRSNCTLRIEVQVLVFIFHLFHNHITHSLSNCPYSAIGLVCLDIPSILPYGSAKYMADDLTVILEHHLHALTQL